MNEKKTGNGLAIAALVLGIVGVAGALIPLVNFVSIILGILAVVFGIIAILQAKKVGAPHGKAIAGLVLGVVTAIGFFFSYVIIGEMADHSDHSSQDNSEPTTAQTTEPAATSESAEETSETSSEEPASRWNPTTKTFTADDATIVINSIDQTTDVSNNPALKINFTITNNSNQEQDVQLLFQEIVTIQQKNATTSNDLDLAILDLNAPDDNLNSNLNPGATIQGYLPVELEDTTNPVVLSFANGFGADVEGTITVTPH